MNTFNNQLKNALNDNAPEITKQVTCKGKKYHGSHKKLGKRRELFEEEKPSGRSTEEMTKGTALKIERSSYRRMLKMAKAESITKMVDDCNRDSKKLYNLAALLMGAAKGQSSPRPYR